MPSLRARLVEALLPLLGIKKFFSQPDRMDARIAKLRAKDPVRPRGKWHKRFDIVESDEDGYTLVTVTPKGGAQPGAPHIMYFHGGGYIMDIAAVHYEAVFKLCEQLGASASVPLYPLAPETKVTTTLPAMRRLYDRLAERYGAGALHVMGDSAGGGMTLALAQDLAATGGDLPASLVLFSPWLDATGSGEGTGGNREQGQDAVAQRPDGVRDTIRRRCACRRSSVEPAVRHARRLAANRDLCRNAMMSCWSTGKGWRSEFATMTARTSTANTTRCRMSGCCCPSRRASRPCAKPWSSWRIIIRDKQHENTHRRCQSGTGRLPERG